jgi:phosphoribosylaminoimidazole (AIR) synthetase
MLRAFNMGVGLVAIAAPDAVHAVRASADAAGVRTWVLGHVAPGAGRVIFA